MVTNTTGGRADHPSGAVPPASQHPPSTTTVVPAARYLPRSTTTDPGFARRTTGVMLLLFGGLSVFGLSVNLGAVASQVVGWALLASALLFLTAYAFDR